MDPDPRHPHGTARRLATVLVTAVLIASCEASGPGSASPATTATVAPPTATPTASVAAPSLVPSPSGEPTPRVEPTPTTPSAPAATDVVLADAYAALRPMNLRTLAGPLTAVRGADIVLRYEIANVSTSSVHLPRTAYANRAAAWYGLMQTWIERLGANATLTACLPQAARDGNRYALSAMPGAIGNAAMSVDPGQGQTQTVFVARSWTSCFPAGRYRISLEYRRIEAQAGEEPIATTSIDLTLTNPTAFGASVGGPGPGQATLTFGGGWSRATSSVTMSQLPTGSKYTYEVRVGCDRDGPILVSPVTFRAGSDGTYRDSRRVSISSAGQRALASGKMPAIWLFTQTYGACMPYLAMASPAATDRAPTAQGGAILRQSLGSGFSVAASSEAWRPGDGNPAHAFDGDDGRTWNSGAGIGGWIELDLGRDRVVRGLSLLPSQLPATARTVHNIYGRVSGSAREVLITSLDGVTSDNVWLHVSFTAPRTLRYLRIETVVSPSTVAWREIRLDGVEVPHPSRLPVGGHDGTTATLAFGNDCYAEGWSSDPDAATDVTIRVLVDGQQVATGLASLSRPDVSAAGAGDTTSGYRFQLAPYLSAGQPHEIRVQAQDLESGAWVDLATTPRLLTCG